MTAAIALAPAKTAPARAAEIRCPIVNLRSRLPAAAAARAGVAHRRALGAKMRVDLAPSAHSQDGLATLRHGGRPAGDEPRSIPAIGALAIWILALGPRAAHAGELSAQQHGPCHRAGDCAHCVFPVPNSRSTKRAPGVTRSSGARLDQITTASAPERFSRAHTLYQTVALEGLGFYGDGLDVFASGASV